MPEREFPNAGHYGTHLSEMDDYPSAPRRGSHSGPEGGARQAVTQQRMPDAPAAKESASARGKARKVRSGGPIRMEGT